MSRNADTDNDVLLQMCGEEVTCVEIRCPLQDLDSNAVIVLRSRLWNSTFLEVSPEGVSRQIKFYFSCVKYIYKYGKYVSVYMYVPCTTRGTISSGCPPRALIHLDITHCPPPIPAELEDGWMMCLCSLHVLPVFVVGFFVLPQSCHAVLGGLMSLNHS